MALFLRILLLAGWAASTALPGPARAQAAEAAPYPWTVAWQAAVPGAGTRDFIASTSWRGFSVEGRRAVGEGTAVGLITGWTTFEDKVYRRGVEGDGSGDGTRLRNLNAFPALAGLERRLLGGGRDPRLVLGMHGGVWWVQRHTDRGPADRTRARWRGAVAPGLGLVIPMGPTAWILQLRYHHLFAEGAADALGWWTMGVGLSYRGRNSARP